MSKITSKQIKYFILTAIITSSSLLSGCKIVENLRRLIDFSEDKQGKPCIIGVWPAVQSGNKKYKMTETRAFQFVIDVQAGVGYSQKYRYVEASQTIPFTCKKLLWHNKKNVSNISNIYRNCMASWGKKTFKEHKICSDSGVYVIGATIVSKNGRARVLVVNLENTQKFANKQERYTSGKNLDILARNIGRTIGKEIR